jgi:serine/threonine protein kinase
VGKLLGKGGFAIAYSGLHVATKQKYALKIVKSKMPPKMEQKVGHITPSFHPFGRLFHLSNTFGLVVSN